ncbi:MULTISPECIES: MBL fold metallo-hydrolase [Streptomyces]|uniref:MBL fold metallo-hydrolase n=1 Tax=Streptomyces TaxID=1883 RepID=UPI00163C277F|nr:MULTISPECIES: MBL fold metallo-hydrolase [Streptomyces]MBC2878917.1 MBL fold metallo-hydrolase [Streptomyces sp. TYQ1024]UBI38896.1 MBL fold metallo-hydrolase [Streptomyces mobaraensis]UKW31475.1 MBL fold metallo-hydrolase [Streptomyces sp. TYQ1024]
MGNHGGTDQEQHRGARWERLAPGVARRRLPRWDATTGAVVGAAGVLVVDTGATLREGAEIEREVRELFGRPVTHIALTHGHFDHVFGTAAFAGAAVYGAAGLADQLAPGELREDAVRYGMDARDAAEAAARLVAPAHEVADRSELDLGGGRRVRLVALGAAHSGHDLAVLVPGDGGAPDVVFCGDLVEESGEPQAGPDATPAAWPAALDRLLALGGDDAVYVPGHGAAVDARFVREQRNALARRFGVS